LARAQDQQPPAGVASANKPDFKVVFWFDGGVLRHQAYDLRKGQYTSAVDEWVSGIRFDPSGYALPGHLATVREVVLAREQGATDSEKLVAAIRRAAAQIQDSSAPRLRAVPWPTAAMPRRQVRARPLYSRAVVAPPAMPFPQPYPYPRPHP
jgi:hypothetical protein